MIFVSQFSAELVRCKDRGVHLAPELAFELSQGRTKINLLQAAYDHQVYVAGGVFPAAGDRAVEHGNFDPVAEFVERSP